MGKSVIWLRLAAALTTGLATALIFPPYDLGFLVWFSFIPLLAALWSYHGKRAGWKGFGLGFLSGAVCHLIQLKWIAVVSSVGAIALPLYLGLFWGLFGAFAATLGNPGKSRSSVWRHLGYALVAGAVWGLLEWLRGWLFTGFSWNVIGVGFQENAVISQAADVFGVVGLSLFTVTLQALLILGIRHRDKRVLGEILALLLLVIAYGNFRLHQEKSRETTPLRALLVQINIPQDAAFVRWDAAEVHLAYEEETLAALQKAEAAGTFPDWVVWPESALTGRIMRTDDGGWGTWDENLITIRNVREAGDFSLIYGAVELEAIAENDTLVRKPDGKSFNSLVVMNPDDGLETFRKHHLVIFGETIPFIDSLPFLKKIYEQQAGIEYTGSFTPGDSYETLVAQAAGRAISIIPTVCFEDSVSRLTRRFQKAGPQIIVNVTNDGWFKESPAADQHFSNARFRTIELRRPMIRCANTGVTAAISSTGIVTHKLVDENGSHFTRGSLLADIPVPIHPIRTLYALIGDAGIIFTGIIALLLSVRLKATETLLPPESAELTK